MNTLINRWNKAHCDSGWRIGEPNGPGGRWRILRLGTVVDSRPSMAAAIRRANVLMSGRAKARYIIHQHH